MPFGMVVFTKSVLFQGHLENCIISATSFLHWA